MKNLNVWSPWALRLAVNTYKALSEGRAKDILRESIHGAAVIYRGSLDESQEWALFNTDFPNGWASFGSARIDGEWVNYFQLALDYEGQKALFADQIANPN